MRPINALRTGAPPGEAGRALPLVHGPSLELLSGPDLDRVLGAVRRRLADRRLALEGGEPSPGSVPLAGRDPTSDLALDGRAGWLALGPAAETTIDPETGARRPSTLADVETAARLADAVPQVGIVGAAVRALDVPEPARPLHELHALLSSTSKHVQVGAPADVRAAEAVVGIARAVAGGELGARPVVSALARAGALEGERLEAAAALARAGVPIGLVAEPALRGAGLAEALVRALAEVLGAAASLRARAPSARVFLAARALRTGPEGVPAGSAALRFQMAFVQTARALGLPAAVEALATGSRLSDWQAGAEGGLGMAAAWMTGPDLVLGAGLREAGRAFSLPALLLDTEAFDLVRPIPLGFAVDEETVAVEVIERVGPGGHFLAEPHTLRHMRETWTSRFMDRDTWETWEGKGRPEPPDHARERARELLATHEPEPLPVEVDARIREVIAEHERRGD